YVGSGGRDFCAHPLDVESIAIPANYLRSQNRIDEVLKTRKVNWSLSAHHSGSPTLPAVVYGCRIGALDDRKREGITFIHGIELNTPGDVSGIIAAILVQIAGATGQRLIEAIADLASATGSIHVEE